eukprot:TRINITY_DN5232_c0_g2_i1.p1 TRINITY_DN5232_c0_g2~~TRINITY_DN5232_c0_g2_i1.p1  ORF type:complete len:349 (-),score=57.98 TRINITY_DN5232_c0_g2_i1:359-1345(-)
MRRGIVRVFFKDDSYKTFSISEDTTPEEICDMFAKKMRLKGSRFHLSEVVAGRQRFISKDEKPLMIQQNHIGKGVSFGESSKNGFICQFKEESLHHLKDKINTNRRLRGSMFQENVNSGTELTRNPSFSPENSFGAPSARDRDVRRKNEDMLLSELEDLKVSLAKDIPWNQSSLGLGRDRTQTCADDKLSPRSEFIKRRNSSPIVSHHVQSYGKLGSLVDHWTIDEVQGWLATNGFSEYAQQFRAEAIDGPALRLLTDADCRDLGMKMGHRKKLALLLLNLSNQAESRLEVLDALERGRTESDADLDDLADRLDVAEIMSELDVNFST